MVRTRRLAPYTIWNNVDWGSQSIAQSKFQRTTPQEGKDFQENIRILVRQSFSRQFRKKFYEGTLSFLFLRSPRPRYAGGFNRREWRTCNRGFLNQALFGAKTALLLLLLDLNA